MKNPLIITLLIISQIGFFRVTQASINESKSAKLLFFGDLMIERGLDRTARTKGIKYFLSDLAGEKNVNFASYDLIGANLEGTVIKNGVHSAPQTKYDFAFRPEVVKQFKDFGFDYFTIANNHITDQGTSGVRQTREKLGQLGFAYSGCPDRTVGDCSLKMVENNGVKFGMLAFSHIFGRFDEKKIVAKITKAKKQSDFVIVNIHWGKEYQKQFNKTQQNIAHVMIDAGADAVIGHHPHVVQGVEIYKNKPIFYSLGNFIFDQFFSVETQTGLAVSLDIDDKKISAKLRPFRGRKAKLAWLKNADEKIWLEKFIKISDKSVKNMIKDGQVDIVQD